MISYDVELFKNLLTHLKTLIQTNVSFFDETTAFTEVCTSPGNRFCELVKKHEKSECKKTDERALNACKRNACPDCSYLCHFCLREAIFKTMHENVDCGYIMIGPFRDERHEAEVLENIEIFCKKYGENREEMVRLYREITVFTEEKLQSLQTIVFAIFDYAVRKNIVNIKHTLFETAIASYVSEHLSEPLSVERLCSQFYLSQKQLYFLVKKATGSSPKQYVLQKRIQAAQTKICSSDEPLQEIAFSVGFADYSHFIKLFKAATSFSPSAYRKRFSERNDAISHSPEK